MNEMRSMFQGSCQTIIAGHDGRYAARVYFHASEDFGLAIYDTDVVVDLETGDEFRFTPACPVSEGSYVFATDEAWESVSADLV